MAHWQQDQFVGEVKSQFPEFFSGVRVLEVGSWIANLSVRNKFESCDYVGADVADGPGVDIVKAGQELEFPSNSFDVVISCECFEHNPFWLETFLNMSRMLKPDGLFVFTCASTGRGEHGTRRTDPSVSLTAVVEFRDYSNYYRNLTSRDFEDHIALDNHFSSYGFVYSRHMRDLYFVGIKRGATERGKQIKSVLKAASRITNPPDAKVGSFGGWALSMGLAKTLGESRYHDLRYRLGRPHRAKK